MRTRSMDVDRSHHIINEILIIIKKIKIVNFLVKDLYFCWSIREILTNLAGEFLEAFSSPPLYRYKTFMKILGEE